MLAERVRKYRTDHGWSVRRLAEECSRHGASRLTQSSLANIERGQAADAHRQRRDVTVDELLVLAYALSVPPVLLLLPLGDEDQVTIVPGVTVHPDLALKWIEGDEAPMTSDRLTTGDLAFWRRASDPLLLYRRLRTAQETVWKSESDIRTAGYTEQADQIEQARHARLDALRELAEVLNGMAELSVRAPALPGDWVEPMLALKLLKHPETVRIVEPQDQDQDRG